MCFNMYGPPYGIPIPPEVHDQYAQGVKDAWETFDRWWKSFKDAEDLPTRKNMPQDVAHAMTTILEAPIPGEDGATGKDSCYMISVLAQLDGE